MSITTNKHDLVCILPNDANFLTMFELSGCIVLFENMSKKTTGRNTSIYAANVRYVNKLKFSANAGNNYLVIYVAKVTVTFFSRVYAKVSYT